VEKVVVGALRVPSRGIGAKPEFNAEEEPVTDSVPRDAGRSLQE